MIGARILGTRAGLGILAGRLVIICFWVGFFKVIISFMVVQMLLVNGTINVLFYYVILLVECYVLIFDAILMAGLKIGSVSPLRPIS